MSKELFVSLTPHETKVAVTEDDQLAEIYFERENEYTLAGSIYKGRVTRVLPGMQSAFVDIGLERDAFLYVSDFFEVEEDGEEIEPVRVSLPRPEPRHFERQERSERQERYREPLPEPQQVFTPAEEEKAPEDEGVPSPMVFEGPETPAASADAGSRPATDEDRGGWRNDRGGRGRRGRRGGRAFPESKFTHPAGEEPHEPRREARDSYGPPPGYQPIILPGESISKYQRHAPAVPVHAEEKQTAPSADTGEQGASPAEPQVFAAETHTQETHEPPVFEPPSFQQQYPETPVDASAEKLAEAEKEVQRLDTMNVATVFGGGEATRDDIPSERSPSVAEQSWSVLPGESIAKYRNRGAGVSRAASTQPEATPEPPQPVEAEERVEPAHAVEAGHNVQEPESRDAAVEPEAAEVEEPSAEETPARPHFTPTPSGTVEEEEIEEEETELPTFSEHIDDNQNYYDELEEETLEPEMAAQGELSAEALAESIEEAEEEREAVEAYEDGEEESEGEEEGTRAEMRGPSATAGFQQRAPRPTPFDRRRGRRGGRRMRPQRSEQRHNVQIADVLKEGQEVLVQIAKEPIGKKGARITSHIALPGRYMVYMPTVNHIGVSRKIGSDEERQRLKRIVMGERNGGPGGFIVRTAAEGISEQELQADIRFLQSLWNEIRTRADSAKPPALIYHDLNLVERTLRDLLNEDFTHVWVDSEQEYERILRFVNRFQPNLVRRIRLYTKETPLYEQFGVQEEINKALKSKVWLKSGGYIVINQTEALVAIDVNTGKYVGKTTRLEDTIVKTNVDAIKEIVRQIRLRDLGGIIVIDFIDMDERKNRQKVMQALEDALKTDRAPSKVLQFNDFGLVAITRKRVKHSLERTLGTQCPYCAATGYVKSVETVCNEIYTEMRKMRKQFEGREIMLRVNPEVAKALKGNNARWLNDLEELTGKSIIIKADPALHQEQFDM
jgi:Rne/Rng family ribonuclease